VVPQHGQTLATHQVEQVHENPNAGRVCAGIAVIGKGAGITIVELFPMATWLGGQILPISTSFVNLAASIASRAIIVGARRRIIVTNVRLVSIKNTRPSKAPHVRAALTAKRRL
jgi:hypothetical protein